TGAQVYGDSAVTLGADTSLTTTNANVTFTSAPVDGADNLTVSVGSGNISFGGAVGGTTALHAVVLDSTGTTTLGGSVTASSVTTDAGGTTDINGGNVTT